jgi:hypothetical protein
MRDGGRRPGAVPDDGADGAGRDGAVDADVRRGTDTDGDGRPDTLLTAPGADLLVLTDLDGDGLADRVLRIGPDAAVHVGGVGHPGVGHPGVGHPDAAHPGTAHGQPVAHPDDGAPAPGPWEALLGPLLRSDT